jgi:heme-degrading monooxygenase HmoA
MYAIVWEYEVKPEAEARFRSAYGPDGPWATLFGASPGFMGVDLYRADDAAGRFLTIDRWRSRDAFVEFMSRNAEAYAALDEKFGDMTLRESRLGDIEA